MSWVRFFAATTLAVGFVALPLTPPATAAAPPQPVIDSGPSNPSNQSTASFAFHINPPDATATFRCQLDGLGFSLCSSPQLYSALGEGSHTFQVKAVNADGESAVASFPWTIDTTPPPVPTIASHASVVASSTTTFAFTSTGASSFQCHVDSAAFATCSSGLSVGPFADGPHTFFVRALDDAGNASNPASFPWTIDTTPPPVPTIASHASVVASSTTTFAFTSTGASSFQCHVDSAAFATCSSGLSVGPFADGPHTFFVRALDDAGNASNPASFPWTIDTAPPVLSITSKPSDPSGVATAHFEFAATDATSVTFQCQLDSGAPQSCATPPGQDYAGLVSARHTMTLTGTDAAGNSSTAPYSWTVDTINPVVTIAQAPTNPTNQTSPSFSFSSSKASSSFQCRLDGGAFSKCTSPTTYASLKGGSHSFSVRATDPIGHTGPTTTYTWTIDLTPPGQVRSLRKTIQYGRLTLAWVLPTDADFDHVQVLVSKGAKKNAQSVAYAGKATQYTDGRFKNGTSYRYAIVSYDHLGNASQPFRVTVAASVLLLSPRNGSTLRSPPRLRWSSVPKATFYNVQLYRGGSKILSAWPRAASLRLKRHWSYSGRHYRLKKGQYQWFVWPGFGPRAKDRYGQLLGQSAFRVR